MTETLQSDYRVLPSAETNSEPNPARRQQLVWWVLLLLYLGIIINNFFNQTKDSWGKYPFELTQISAWLALIQHLQHPYSPLPSQECSWHGRWPCLTDDNYTHAQGLSNLALNLQVLVAPMYWGVAFPQMKVAKPGGYVNAALMHGGITFLIALDYLLNGRPFHFCHTLLNLALFLPLYAVWNYLGQQVKGDPVYPSLDWIDEPKNIAYAAGLACVGAIVIALSLKGVTYLRRGKCPYACAFLTHPQQEDTHSVTDLNEIVVEQPQPA